MKKFTVENYRGIKGTVEVSPTGNTVVVQGRNAAGKSSFVDAIVELFDARGIRLTPKPIHDGEDSASAEFIDTELDVRIVRTWKRGADGGVKSSIAVYTLDGAKHAKSADVIARLTGGLIFDPSRFLQLDPKPQRDMLLRAVELPFDLDELEAEERAAEERRTAAGQALKAAEGALASAEQPAPGTPSAPVSTSDLVAKLDEAREHNARIDQAVWAQQQHSAAQDRITDQIKDLEAQIERLRKQYAEESSARTEAKKAAEQPRIDTTELESQVANVDETNRNVQLAERLGHLKADVAEKRSKHDEEKRGVEEIRKRKDAGLREAGFPHPSLSVSQDGVLYDGVPFSQVNTGQREEAAFAIATSGQPDLRLVVVKNGDMMDEDSLARIDRIAAERDYTVLIERGRPDVGGLIATFVEMEDGQAVS